MNPALPPRERVPRLKPYVKANHDEGLWPVHVAYDELSERQVEGYIHPWGLERKRRRALLATARRRPAPLKVEGNLTHRRGTSGGRLLTRAERGLPVLPTCEHGRTTYHGRRDKETKCSGPA